MKKYIEAGKIVGTHGIKGELRVQPWADSGEFLASFRTLYMRDGAERLEITAARPFSFQNRGPRTVSNSICANSSCMSRTGWLIRFARNMVTSSVSARFFHSE